MSKFKCDILSNFQTKWQCLALNKILNFRTKNYWDFIFGKMDLSRWSSWFFGACLQDWHSELAVDVSHFQFHLEGLEVFCSSSWDFHFYSSKLLIHIESPRSPWLAVSIFLFFPSGSADIFLLYALVNNSGKLVNIAEKLVNIAETLANNSGKLVNNLENVVNKS